MLHRLPSLERQDATFEAFLDQVQFEIQTRDLTPEKRRQRRAAADVDDLAFAATYFPRVFTSGFSDLHRHLAALHHGKFSISGFPQAGKSAFAYLAKMVKHIALGRGGMAVVACRTDDIATARTSSLSRLIQRNPTLVYDYGIEVEQDKAGYHIFKAEGGSTHLVAGSVNTGLRSIVDDDFKRIRIGIGDDLFNKETVRSETDNKRVYDWITGELWRQMEDDGLCMVFGNSIAENAPIVQLRRNFPDTHFSFPILHPDGTPTWPERFTAEDVEAKRVGPPPVPFDVWSGEYLDDPAESGDTFKPEWLRTTRVDPADIVASITVIDPSYGESPEACFKGAATLAMLRNHHVVVTGLFVRRAPYAVLFDWLLDQQRITPRHRVVLFENDFSQWAFAQPYYMAWLESRKAVLPIVTFNSKDNATEFRAADKDSRILNLVHPHQTGLFFYDAAVAVPGNDDWEQYRKQVLAFGARKTKLDGLDAVASAYILIRRYLETETFKPLAKRRMPRPSWMDGGGWR